MSATHTVSLDQYLNTSYKPDMELIDGELKEKAVTAPIHGKTQARLMQWFLNHEDKWGIQAYVEPRTKVTGTNVRLPDAVVTYAGPTPAKALVDAPLIAIEVRSESDKPADLRARAQDLASMGVRNVWLIEPEDRRASVWSGDAWERSEQLRAADTPIYLDLGWLWKKLG